mgnify:CR=1 FL=1
MAGNRYQESPRKKIDSFTNSCYEWLEALIASLIVVVVVFTFLFRVVNVSGSSMLPTLESNDRVLLSSLFYTPKQGDVVVISRTVGLSKPIIKRVIATEGQTVDIDFNRGIVYVDGEALEEPYINEPTYLNYPVFGFYISYGSSGRLCVCAGG